jgi:hypothetical protein
MSSLRDFVMVEHDPAVAHNAVAIATNIKSLYC